MKEGGSRPVLNIQRTWDYLAIDIISLVLCLLGLGLVAMYWSQMPEKVAAHFDAAGRPNCYQPRAVLWYLSGGASLIWVLFTLMSCFPHKFNYPGVITEANAARQYVLAMRLLGWLKLEYAALLFFCVGSCIDVTLHPDRALNSPVLVAFLISILGTVGFYLSRLLRGSRI